MAWLRDLIERAKPPRSELPHSARCVRGTTLLQKSRGSYPQPDPAKKAAPRITFCLFRTETTHIPGVPTLWTSLLIIFRRRGSILRMDRFTGPILCVGGNAQRNYNKEARPK